MVAPQVLGHLPVFFVLQRGKDERMKGRERKGEKERERERKSEKEKERERKREKERKGERIKV